jgi:hypothetical protein
LVGAGLYAASFNSSEPDCAATVEHAKAVEQDDLSKLREIDDEAGAGEFPGTQALPNDARQVHIATGQAANGEISISLSNDLAPVTASVAANLPRAWGAMLRGAPVHSGPDVSSAILGYVAAGTGMLLLEREFGWVRVLDPATARQGWIYEKYIFAHVGPDGIETGADSRQQAALANEAELGASDDPARSFKSQKPRKKIHFKEKTRLAEESCFKQANILHREATAKGRRVFPSPPALAPSHPTKGVDRRLTA